MNAEDEERAMDAAWRNGEIIHKTDLYDSPQDARSENRYESDRATEPKSGEYRP